MRGCSLEVFKLFLGVFMLFLVVVSIFLFGRVLKDGWYLYPGSSFLGGVAFIGCALLLGLCGRAVSQEKPTARAPRIYKTVFLKRGMQIGEPMPYMYVPRSCAMVALLPAVLGLVLFGLLLLVNSVAVGLFGINIASWLFTIPIPFR